MRLHQIEDLITLHNPDIIGIQETKVTDDQFPLEAIKALGYHSEYTGQKTHYGVALLSKQAPTRVVKQFPNEAEDAQKRFIACSFRQPDNTQLHIINGYFPQGESRNHPTKFPNKQQFYANLLTYLNTHFQPTDAIIVMGDMNISHQDKDIGIGEDNRKRWLRTGKCSFLPEEREWLQQLLDWGFIDTYRQLHPERNDVFSWFDYRSKGFEQDPKHGLRIDLILATQPLAQHLIDAGIDYNIRAMDKPSDHCPVWATFTDWSPWHQQCIWPITQPRFTPLFRLTGHD